MALPAELTQRFSPELLRSLRLGNSSEPANRSVLRFGVEALDAVLPEGGFAPGGVVELAAGEGVPAALLALTACRSLGQAAARAGREAPWCAFLDPTETLHAPGVVASGARLDRLLVVRPPLEALARTAERLAKSTVFELVVIDGSGVLGARLAPTLKSWPRLVRRLALSVEQSLRGVLILTELGAPRALPLPVAQRIEIRRLGFDRFSVAVAKDRQGRVSSPRSFLWAPGRAVKAPAAALPSASPPSISSGGRHG